MLGVERQGDPKAVWRCAGGDCSVHGSPLLELHDISNPLVAISRIVTAGSSDGNDRRAQCDGPGRGCGRPIGAIPAVTFVPTSASVTARRR
jgi:hypothetical protein